MKKNLYIMYAIALLQGMVFYSPIATLYRQAQGVTLFQITVIEGISLALGILLELPWGVVADKIGYRNTMVFCSGLYFVSKLVFWKATGFGGFLAERIMLSVVLSGFPVWIPAFCTCPVREKAARTCLASITAWARLGS